MSASHWLPLRSRPQIVTSHDVTQPALMTEPQNLSQKRSVLVACYRVICAEDAPLLGSTSRVDTYLKAGAIPEGKGSATVHTDVSKQHNAQTFYAVIISSGKPLRWPLYVLGSTTFPDKYLPTHSVVHDRARGFLRKPGKDMDGKLGCLAGLEAKIPRKDIHGLRSSSSCRSNNIIFERQEARRDL